MIQPPDARDDHANDRKPVDSDMACDWAQDVDGQRSFMQAKGREL
jgi:hypothetical protein